MKQFRPPIVAILGHVDHGKTTLLDYIRKSSLTAKEPGEITQKIGAYEIKTDIKGYNTDKITFIDTPGHEAFSRLRVRGANVADIAILIVDAKDSVMPQTTESISHIKSAKIPIIVAVNKIDLPEANPEKVKNDLIKNGVLVEGKGGNVPIILISAKTGKGISELLEAILLVSSDLRLTYAIDNPAQAFIIESKKDKRGVLVSVIIKDGKLSIGDFVQAGSVTAKVRAMFDDRSRPISEVLPSSPFELLGFSNLPEVGSLMTQKPKLQSKSQIKPKPAETIPQPIREIDVNSLLQPAKQTKKLTLIIKVDSIGSLEAINQQLSDKKNVEIVLVAVGDVHKSDIFLAKNTKSVIIGFSVMVSDDVKQLAKQEKIIIKTYNIIYELLEELEEITDLLTEKQEKEKNIKGSAQILARFMIEGEKIFGVKISKGKINLGDNIEWYRNDKLLGKTKLISLKIRAKVVSQVKKGQEAGMLFNPQLDFSVGDVVKSIL